MLTSSRFKGQGVDYPGNGWRITQKCSYCGCLFLIVINIFLNVLYISPSVSYLMGLFIGINFLLVSNYKVNFFPPLIQSFLTSLVITIATKILIKGSSLFIFPVLFGLNYLSYFRFAACGKKFRSSFTPCEMLIVTQGALICLTQSALCELATFIPSFSISCSSDLTTRILQTLFIGLAMTLIAMSAFGRDNLSMVYVCFFTGLFLIYSRIAVVLNREPLSWLFLDVLFTSSRIHLSELWACLFIFTIFFCVIVEALIDSGSKTIIRKFFHLIIIPVYATGLKYDPAMLYFLSACLLWILITLEALRVIDPENIGKSISFIMERFKNSNDRGLITLTHIYLLIGLSLSLWLSPNIEKITFNQTSGMITIGIGDTAAAVIGSLFGKHKWTGTNKSIEGTIGATLCQIIASIVASSYLQLDTNILLIIVLSLISSLIEAKTIQIDNLVLPLYFNLIWLTVSLMLKLF